MDLHERIADLLDASDAREIVGGHQARVFLVTHQHGARVIAKVMDAELINRGHLDARVAAIGRLAELSSLVSKPIPTRGQLVHDVLLDEEKPGFLTCYAYADGRTLDTSSPADAAVMGRALSALHRLMRRVQSVDLPIVAALQSRWSEAPVDYQMLHGDFNVENLRKNAGLISIFDFDDCGRGPTEFDLANALYMVRFDTLMSARHPESYAIFHDALLAGYGEGGGRPDLDLVHRLVDHRVTALEHWLDDLKTAPIGIRTASPSWHKVLRTVIARYWTEPRLSDR